MIRLAHVNYPRETLKPLDDLETGFKYARSSLGLWGLNKNYHNGFYKVATTDFELIKQQGCQHSQFASHVESEYLFSTNPKLKEEYCRMGGRSLRYGKIIEELDAMAGDCSYKYLMKNDDPDTFDPEKRGYYLVTVSVDRVDFMSKLSAERDLKLSAYMLMAKGSTLMVKIDVLQKKGEAWEQVGDAIIVFVARDAKTGKAYKIPDMKPSTYDDILSTSKCIEIGLTIKDWSRDKSLRDMHSVLPDFEES
jgi:acyl-CoA thioesterase FadM